MAAGEQKMLQAHGHKVLTYLRNNGELAGFSLWQKMCLPFSVLFNPRTYREVREIIRKENIQLVHVHNTLMLISPAVYYAARREGAAVVQSVHNFRLLCPGAVFYRNGHVCEDCLQKGLELEPVLQRAAQFGAAPVPGKGHHWFSALGIQFEMKVQ